MKQKIAIIGSGPTSIYTLKGLLSAQQSLSITIFEIDADAGKGMPYHPDINDQAMLANIASVELPELCESLVGWLRRQPSTELQRLNLIRENIKEREFYPRVVLGEYFQSQFRQLIDRAIGIGHTVDVKTRHRVVDIRLRSNDIQLTVTILDGKRKDYSFDHVVMATGHDWPVATEIKPGFFTSPWPAKALKKVPACAVGILGTSLSAIDALMAVSTTHGAFYLDPSGQLQYQGAIGSDAFHASLMSRKGLLPEADFYCDYPYTPLRFCTVEAVDALVKRGSANLLDNVFELFKRELMACDPNYAGNIGLSLSTIETISPFYFAARARTDPFVWAASNLAEAEQNKKERRTVAWRYAILRMHEVVARAVPFLDKDDLIRFQKNIKSLFVDDYATVPHQTIQRLLALRRAEKLQILRLGKQYEIITNRVKHGAVVRYDGKEKTFDAFIDATGQKSMSARDMPFPSLLKQGVVKLASTRDGPLIEDASTQTGGVDLDSAFRPKFVNNLCNRLYCAAISFLLHKLPFVQGITSAHEIGEIVAKAVLRDIGRQADPTIPAGLSQNS